MQSRFMCILTCLGSTALLGQDVLKVAPAGVAKVEYEDAQVRVLRFKEAAGSKLAMHSHPAYVDVGFTDDVTHFTFPDGKTSDEKSKAGEASFSKAITHAAQNTGNTTSESIMVELKTKPAGVAVGGAGDIVTTNPKMTKVELDNEYVRVTRVTLPAHGKLAMHSHPSANVVVYITGGKTKTTTDDGKAQEMTLAPRSVRVNPAGKHANENLDNTGTVAVLIELKTAAK